MNAKTTFPPETRWWDALSALLLMCALLTAAGRMVVTQWTDDLFILQTITLLGGMLGLVLGQSRFSPGLVILITFGYGLFLLPWQMGMAVGGDMLYKERLLILVNRLMVVINELAQKKPVSDNVLFLQAMALVFWVLSVFAGYSLTRYANAWRAALPTGLVLLIVHSYDPLIVRRAWFLAAFLLFSLLLIARLHFTRRRMDWRRTRTYVPPDIGFDWIRFTLFVAVMVVVFAWTAPAMAETLPAAQDVWLRVKRPWAEFQNNISHAFQSLQATVGVFSEYYTESFTLSYGTALPDTPVMEVDAPPRSIPGMRFYWRAYVYDNYTEGSWRSSLQETQVVKPNDFNLKLPEYNGRIIETFTFKVNTAIGTLYTPAQPVWISREANATLGRSVDGTADLAAFQAMPAVTAGSTYQVRASITAASVAQLRDAGDDYPQWVLDRYLQLPEEITDRTRELALEIKGDNENAYDIAAAVTEYLRTYPYVEVIDPPPPNRELIDWWLFDYRRGFCQYYATAEVVLLRSLGIPARMAIGYAEGEFLGTSDTRQTGGVISDPEDPTDHGGMYLVRQKDRHTWPEVYFPGIGWVEFEPTAGQANIVRPSGEQRDNTDAARNENNLAAMRAEAERRRLLELADFDVNPDNVPAGAGSEAPRLYWPYYLLGGLAITAMVVVVWRRNGQFRVNLVPLPVRMEKVLRRMGIRPPAFLSRWAYLASLSPLLHSYMEINRALRLLGQTPKANATPAERAQALIKLLPVIQPSVQILLAEYQLSVYSQKPANLKAARQASAIIRSETWRTVIRSLFRGRTAAAQAGD